MATEMARQRFTHSLAAKLTGAVFLLILILLSGFSWGLSHYARGVLENKAIEQIQARTELVVAMIASYDAALTQEAERLMGVFAGQFEGRFSLDPTQRVQVGEHSAPTLRDGATPLNLDLALVDRYSALTQRSPPSSCARARTSCAWPPRCRTPRASAPWEPFSAPSTPATRPCSRGRPTAARPRSSGAST